MLALVGLRSYLSAAVSKWNPMNKFLRPAVLAVVVASLAIGPALAIELSPHRAVYSMNILSVRSNSDFVDIRGQMLLDWSDVCDGWTLNQRVKMIFTPREGKPLENEFSFSSWESKDGSRFRYTMRTITNGNVVEEVDGRATLTEAGGTATFTLPEETEIALPAGTLFPTEHLFLVVEKALGGGNMVIRPLFSGTGLDGLNDTTAFIGPVIPPGGKPLLGEADREPAVRDLEERRSWQVAMAYFVHQGEDSKPEFEVHFRLMDNGVSSSMDLDYGSFSVRALLDHLEIQPQPDC